jgi:high-affinity iron transporter
LIGALIIVFREIIEAGLIVGILMAATHSVRGSRAWIFGGVAAGLLGSAVVAIFTRYIAEAFQGYGQELFNAAILAAAVLMLIWHNLWMVRHGRGLAADLKETGRDIVSGKKTFWAMALIVAVAVMREGSEVVLFLYGVAANDGTTAVSVLTGGLIGLALGGVVSALAYLGMLAIPMRHFFTATNWLITLLAAGMAAQCVSFLERAGVATIFGQTLWNSSSVLSEKSVPGRVLHTLVGYADQPSLLQLMAYLAVIAVIVVSTRALRPSPTSKPA